MSFGKGNLTRFWLDPWLYNDPLSVTAPILFALCENKDISVAQALSGVPITFRRWLFEELSRMWDNIWHDARNFQLGSNLDTIMWNLNKNLC